jgi:hypothetical protein
MPVLLVVLTVVAAFPPDALTIGLLDHSAFSGLLIAQQRNNFLLAIVGFNGSEI